MGNFRKNIGYVYSANVINGLLGIIFVPLCLKFLGTEGYGLFAIYGVLASFIALADLGIGKNLQRLLAAEDNLIVKERHLRSAFGLYLIIGVILLLLTPISIFLIPEYVFPVSDDKLLSLRLIILYSTLEYILAVPVSMTQNYCFSRERFDLYAKFSFVSGVTRYGLLFLGVLAFASPSAVVGVVVLRKLIDIFTSRHLMGALPSESWRPRFNAEEYKSILAHSTALSAGQLMQSIVISAGTFLVNRHFGLEGVGKYRVAFDLASKIWFLSNGIGLVVFPRFVRQLRFAARDETMISRIYSALNLSWIFYLLIGAVGALVAPHALNIMKIDNNEITNLLVILVVGICINAHANLSYELLQASQKYREVNALAFLSLAAMIASFYSTKDFYGLSSIGWAWLMSQALYAIISDIVAIRSLSARGLLQVKMISVRIFSIILPLVGIAAHIGWIANELLVISPILLFSYFAIGLRRNFDQLVGQR